MSQTITPKFAEKTLPELDAGVFEEKLNRSIRDIALATVTNDDSRKRGEVTIKLKMERVKETHQISLTHRIETSRPTPNGKEAIHDETNTVLYVNHDGSLTVTPDNQMDFLKNPTKETEQ